MNINKNIFQSKKENKNILNKIFENSSEISHSSFINFALYDNDFGFYSNKERMLFLSNQGFTTATDFADYLVKNNNISFRAAYKISAKLVNYAEKKKVTLNQLTLKELQKFFKDLNHNVLKVFDVKNSMNTKNSFGGTSEKNIKNMIKKYRKEI